jgi:hypothetical protein
MENPMKRMAQISTTLAVLAALTGCSSNSCEFWSIDAANPTYYCWQGEARDFCEAGGGGPVNSAYHEGQTCADLGYANQCTQDEIGEGALQDQWTSGSSCDSTIPPVGRTPGGGEGGPCLVGTWDTDPHANCLDQFSTTTYAADGTGIVFTPECTGLCAKEDNFVEITWSTDTDDAGTLTLTYGRTVSCGIDNPAPPLTVSVPFTCDSNTAAIDGLPWHRR